MSHLKNMTARLKREIRTFTKRNHGLAAVEFAMVLPFMATITFGTAELMLRYQVTDQFARYTFQVGDLITRYENTTPTSGSVTDLDDDELKSLLKYASDSMQGKFAKGAIQLNVASIGFDNKKGEPKTLWTRSFSTGTKVPHTFDENEVVGMGKPLETIIRIEMTADMKTPYSYFSPGSSMEMEKVVYFRPRTERVLEIDGVAAETNKNWES